MGSQSLRTFKAKWSNVDRTADPQEYVRILDAVRPVDDASAYANLLSVLEVHEGDQILDIGCGTGGLTRVLATIVGNAGRIVGADKSATMIAAALNRSDSSNLRVEYHVANTHALPFATNLFDSCCSIGIFEIVDDPTRVLQEMLRVSRPGGQICVQCADSGTIAIDASDKAGTRSILDYACDFEGNGWLGRQLPRMFAEQGMVDIRVAPLVQMSNNLDYPLNDWVHTCATNARRAGVVSAEQAVAWTKELEERAAAGILMWVSMAFLVAGRKSDFVE